jgi:hypothetical protein
MPARRRRARRHGLRGGHGPVRSRRDQSPASADRVARAGTRSLGKRWADAAGPGGAGGRRARVPTGGRTAPRAGVRHVRLHDGRHTAATLLLSEGLYPRVVMELLGHSRMRTTMDIYSHVLPALAREAADRMGTVLLAGEGRRTATATATRDDSGRPAEGERPGQRGGAEELVGQPTPTLPGRLRRVREDSRESIPPVGEPRGRR